MKLYKQFRQNRHIIYREKIKQIYLKYILKEIVNYKRQNKKSHYLILDAGCGRGDMSEKLNYSPNTTVIGFDIVNQNPSIPFFEATVNAMPVKSKSADIIIFNHVLEHLDFKCNALMELRRVLKDDGILIVGVPNENCLCAWLRNHIIQKSILKKTPHINFFTLNSLIKFLEFEGFKIQSTYRDNNFYLPHTQLYGLMMSALIGAKIIKFLGILFPSQTANLFCVCTKKGAL